MERQIWIVIYESNSRFSRPMVSGIYYSREEAEKNAEVPKYEDITYVVDGPHTIKMEGQ